MGDKAKVLNVGDKAPGCERLRLSVSAVENPMKIRGVEMAVPYNYIILHI